MRLCEALGFPGEEEWPAERSLRVEHYEVAMRLCEQLHRCRAVVTLADLAGMTVLEREILAHAGDRVRAEEALEAAAAFRGRSAEVMSVLDGGQAMLDQDLSEWADALEGK